MKDSDFKRLNMNKLSKPPKRSGLYRIIKNSYWLLDVNGDGLSYKGYSYQYNRLESVGDDLIKNENYPGVMKEFFETIYLPED